MQCADLEKKQYNSIDLVKFLMAFAVVAIHTRPLTNCKNESVLTIYSDIVNMAVPFFFLATGYLLSKKMSFPYTKSDISLIKRHFIKISKMYFLWMIIYTPLSVYNSIVSKVPPIDAMKEYVRRLIFFGEQYNSWPLWYLLSMMYALIIIMILIRIKVSPTGLLLVGLLFSAVSNGVNWFVGVEGDMPTKLLAIQKLIDCTIINGRIFIGMIYVPFGMYLAHRQLPRLGNAILVVGGFLLNFFIANNVISAYLLMVTAIGLFGIIESVSLKNNPIYPWLRNMSTILYLIHMYVWSFYYKFVYGKKTFGLDSFVVTSIVSCIIAFIYLIVKRNIKTKKENKKFIRKEREDRLFDLS